MNNQNINQYLNKYIFPLQELATKHNTPIGEVLEIAELYLIINSTWDTLHLYRHLDHYNNEELKNAISHFVCDNF